MSNNKWFKNLTDIQIPNYVVDTLSLGEKFNFKIDLNYKDFFEILKSVAVFYNKNLDYDMINKIKRRSLCIVNKNIHNKQHININDRIISYKLEKTKKFMKDNKDILFTRADKGKITSN